MSGFMGKEMGPGEGPAAHCTAGQPIPLISVIHLIPALKISWKYHVQASLGLCGGESAQFLLVFLSIVSFLKSIIILPRAFQPPMIIDIAQQLSSHLMVSLSS